MKFISQLKSRVHQCDNNYLVYQMSKYSKVYLHNKKQSNVSRPLRYSFLRSIFVEEMSVKNAALKWKIHYSTAKIIARQARRSNLEVFFQNQNKQSKQGRVCTWKQINSCSVEYSETLSSKSDSIQGPIGNIPIQSSFFPKNKIQIFSTIGWNFQHGEIPDHLNY